MAAPWRPVKITSLEKNKKQSYDFFLLHNILKVIFFRGPLITNLAHRSSESMWPPLKSFPYYSKHSFGNLENNEMFITRLASNPETQEEAAVAAGVPLPNLLSPMQI